MSADHAQLPFVESLPLVVDLDGTLIRSDLLVETTFSHLGANPLRLFALIRAFLRGKAALKAEIARETMIDTSNLPYDERVLQLIQEARKDGRTVYLASASNQRYVQAIAQHLGLDGWFASTESENLSSSAKAKRLVDTFGEKRFDYVGNSRADLAVWAMANLSIAVHPTASLRRELTASNPQSAFLEPRAGQLQGWLKLTRPHQWVKNVLVLVPLLTSHRLDLGSIAAATGAFIAFSLAASAIYILNDLVDINADRRHPSKRRRPLAEGSVPIIGALAIAPFLALTAFILACAIDLRFVAVLTVYLVLTTAYTFVLKRKMMVDIVALALLYTVRVIGGAAAISVPVSEWLLAFSMFIFTALALIKRYVELAERVDSALPELTNRNYRKSDLDIVAALAAAAGFNAVTVFALYISSDAVRLLYKRPEVLWLVCPILMYWIGRSLLMAHRRMMDDDPIVFALKDWNSRLAIGLIGAIMVLATI